MKYLHIDADLIVYRAGFAAEKMVYFVDDLDGMQTHQFDYKTQAMQYCKDMWIDESCIQGVRKLEPVGNALHNVKSIIHKCQTAYPEFDPVLYLSGPTNFREGVAVTKPYKGNRDPTHKPQHAKAIKDYMQTHYYVVMSEDEEADDTLAVAHMGSFYAGDAHDSIVCSVDKDLNMIPGHHFNFVTETGYWVSEYEADRNFWKQMIMGDPTDNIPGIPGRGPKAAEAAMEARRDYADMEEKVYSMYVEYYKDEADAKFEEMGRLLWIRREPNQMWKKGLRP